MLVDLLIVLLFFNWMVEFIIRDDTLNNTGMHEVDARGESDDTFRIIKNGIEASKERLSKDPFVDVIVLKWNKAFISITDINHKRFGS